jgi:hypothetical protein
MSLTQHSKFLLFSIFSFQELKGLSFFIKVISKIIFHNFSKLFSSLGNTLSAHSFVATATIVYGNLNLRLASIASP